MPNRFRLQPAFFTALEAGVIGLFFVQALRLLIGLLYSRTAGAIAFSGIDPTLILPGTPIPADAATITNEFTFLAWMLALPLVALLLGQYRPMIPVTVILIAVGRALMFDNPATAGLTRTPAAALTVMAGLLYIALIVRHRLRSLPYFFILGFAGDQLIRALGNTLDPSWTDSYINVQIGLSVAVGLLSLVLIIWETRRARTESEGGEKSRVSLDYGLLPLWSAVGIGAGLFLQVTLLALPNAVAARGNLDYTTLAPFLIVATLLPIIPAVRGAARSLIDLFDKGTRGWVWLLLTLLAIVLGLRVYGLGAALVIAQFLITLLWWWIGRPKTARERSFGGLWLLVGVGVFALLLITDNFTYEYAFVRDLTGNLRFLNDVIPPLLRGFRDMGIVVIALALFLASLPMIATRRSTPWQGGTVLGSVAALIVVAAAAAGVTYAARPPVVPEVRNVDQIRIGTYNIHSGYGEFYSYDLEMIARAIQQSGANIVLLQEVEAGRFTSFGVDQPLWLGRRLGMQVDFFPTMEGLHGLAVLSNIRIAYADGELLPSLSAQTGVQRVQITPGGDTVITVYNTWLSPLLEISGNEGLPEQEQDQNRQLDALFGVVAAHHANGILGRTVIGGTFHNIPDSDLLQQMRIAGFIDPFAGLPLEIGATFVRVGQPRARFDYLWLRNLPLGEGVNVSPVVASDHRLAYAAVLIR